MTDEMKEMADEAVEAGRTFTERVSVTGGDLIETVQSLLREATVRKITIQDKDGRNLLEIPLYAGIAGALGTLFNGRICDMEIDERSDNAMVSDLAPVFAALNQRPHETQLT